MSYRNFLALTFAASWAAVLAGRGDSSSFEARGERSGRLEVRVVPESMPVPAEPVRGQLQLRGIDVDVRRHVSLPSGGEPALDIVLPAGAYDVSFEPEATPAGDAPGRFAATPLAAAEAGLPRIVVVISAQRTRLLVHTRTLRGDTSPHALDAAALARR
jgi:hypothetical protein